MQIKNTTRCHFTVVRMAIIKKKNLQAINAKERMHKRESSCIVGRNINWYSHYADILYVWTSFKKLK